MTPAKMARSATFSRWLGATLLSFYLDIWTQLLDWETYQAAIGGEAACIQNELDDQTRWRFVRTKKSRSFEMIREGRSAEVQVLMRLAMERPKAFSKMFCAALLTPPKNWRALARGKDFYAIRFHT